MRRVFVGALLLLAVTAPTAASGQAEWMAGRVVGAGSGEPVAGAVVVVDSLRTVTTAADGRWRVGPLATGRHEVVVRHASYAEARRTVRLGDGAPASVRIELTPRPIPLDAVVVTAGRRAQRLSEAVVAMDLVTRREIRETGASNVAAVLTERTGVQLQAGHPSGAGVMIQGMGSERVLVLVDGQPFIGRVSGQIDVSRIPTSVIERIEVVEGPQSTLYGSEAMGGVVNVITRKGGPSPWSVSGDVTTGDRGRLDISASGAADAGSVSLLADVGRRSAELTPGQSAHAGALAERWDGFASARWHTPIEGLDVMASGLLLDERQRWRTGQLYHFTDNLQWSGRVGAGLTAGRHHLTSTLYATEFEQHSRQATSETPVSGTGETETQRLLEAELLWGAGIGGHALSAGVEARRESIESDRVAGIERETRALESYAQVSLDWGRLTLVPGLRASWSDPWGSHWTPRLAALYRPVPTLALRASLAEGFRSPDFKELYMDFLNVGPGFGYTVRGNPDLTPETSTNLTASVEWVGERTYVKLSAFENRFDDFIETQAVADSAGITVFSYGNVDDGFTRGAQLEAGFTSGGWRVEAGAGLLRAERADTGEPLLGRPGGSARATLSHVRPSGLRLSLTGLYTAETAMRRTEAGTQWRDGFLRFDTRAAYDLPGGFSVTFGVDNILDQAVADWPGLAGRHVYTGLSWHAAGDSAATP